MPLRCLRFRHCCIATFASGATAPHLEPRLIPQASLASFTNTSGSRTRLPHSPILQDGSFLAPAVSTSHPLATAIIVATTVPRRNRPTCHRSCRCGLAFIGAVATAFILATPPPPPHVDHRRAADVQADVQAVVAIAAPASRWFGRARSPASWGCLASSALSSGLSDSVQNIAKLSTWSRGSCTRDTAHPARGAATPTPAGAHAV